LKGITIGLGRIKDCTVTPLFRAPNLNRWPTRVVWFRFPWSAVYITATSAWPPNLLLYRTTNDHKIKGRQLTGTITGTTVKGTVSSGGRLACSETPCDARLAGLRTLSVLLSPERGPKSASPEFFGWTTGLDAKINFSDYPVQSISQREWREERIALRCRSAQRRS